MKLLKKILFLFCPIFAGVSVEKIASNFDKPIYVSSIPGENSSLLVIEQKGVIKLCHDSIVRESAFLDIRDRVHNPLFPGDERGLLGFAFDPNYINNKYFYVNYVNEDGATIVSRFTSENYVVPTLFLFRLCFFSAEPTRILLG